MARLLVVALLLSSAGCPEVNLNGRPCADEEPRCLAGYRCNPTTNVCEPEDGECELGTIAHCSACGDDCSTLDHVSTAECDTSGSVPACAIVSCEPGWVDQDGRVSTGCEVECTPTGDPTEICDGEDNDCDGVTDPECPCQYLGDPDGVCGTAVRDALGACQTPADWVSNEVDVCDGDDNDCDGTTDEGCICNYGGTSIGVCANGTPDGLGGCNAPANYHDPEGASYCDGADNDCDGSVDEGCPCDYNSNVGVCANGTRDPAGYCTAPADWTANEGGPTWCDGNDNDCDGDTDEEGYDFLKRITIDAEQVDGTGVLPDFPLLVAISDDAMLKTNAEGGNVTSDQGYDIVFKAPGAGCGVILDHEIELYDGVAGTLVAWVRIPTLSKTEGLVLEMHYGRSGAPDRSDNEAVFVDPFVLVLHMNDATTSSLLDSTSNDNDGAKGSDNQPNELDGKIGKAQEWNGDDEFISVDDADSLDMGNQFTATVWVSYTQGATPADYERILTKKYDWNSGSGWEFSLETGYDDELTVRGSSGTGTAGANNVVTSWAAGGWVHLAVVYEGTTATVYRDGEVRDTVTIAAVSDSSRPLYLGRYGHALQHNWYGTMDEVRLADTVRSAEWIKTSFNNQSDPSAFYSVTDE